MNNYIEKIKLALLRFLLFRKVFIILHKTFFNKAKFTNSKEYWESRYISGGNSGLGSYNHLAKYKAEFLNDFAKKQDIEKVIELGCGDGSQLKLFDFNRYVGYDISETIILKCKEVFKNDSSKNFRLLSEWDNDNGNLSISLDVIYHLIENESFHEYMNILFNSSTKYVIIYSSNGDKYKLNGIVPHVKHRKFTDWVEKNYPQFKLVKHFVNPYPYNRNNKKTSLAEFFIYKKDGKF